MDSFITVTTQKKEPVISTIHTKQIELIRKYIRERKNVFICGALGVGKSYILERVLEGFNHVELLPEHMKSKSLFLPFIKPTTKHVFIENYDPIFKPIIEQIADGDRISRGCLLVTTTSMCMYPNFETVFIPKHTPEVLMKLTEDRGPHIENAAIRAQGNIRNFFTYIEGYDEIDNFQTPKEFIIEILSDPRPIQLYESIAEHGHLWDVFQENYLDSKGVDINKAIDAFSEADIYDTRMYSRGDWYLMPYFILNALTLPKSALGEPLDRDKIRPGSCWTKFGNYKMRKHKYDDIHKKSRMGLGIEELGLLKKYAEKGELQPLMDYKITPQDFDVINHLTIGNNLKSRDVTRIKKALQHAYDR